MTAAHRLARRVLTVAFAGTRGPWGAAVVAELDHVTGTWAVVRWTLGGLRVASRALVPVAPLERRAVRLVLAVTVVSAAAFAAFTVRGIPSGAMAPTLDIGDHAIVDRLTFRVTGIDRGDVVVLRVPTGEGGAFTTVDRVIGVGGDTIDCAGGRVRRDGTPLDEPYIHGAATDCSPVTVPDGMLYVLGDNREVARDSRHYGPQPAAGVRGTVLLA
ncbi:signal peptidase I [Dactylosporangium sp. NPDC005555]|uniref:signal peptidase I n=1 Tax=Dactylosporangium sp. NPDC005555 TaxID=3154889 RepID=UPI0033A69F06